MASARSFGKRACSARCSGQVMPMMNSASTSGANTISA
jgi:hypothetical protein